MHSYSSIYNLGHKSVETLFNSEVLVEEKVDGSQFSFGMYETEGLIMKSKGAILYPPINNKLFKAACGYVMSVRHLRDDGKLQNAPQDIGPLLKEISQDVLKERAEEIKEELFKQAWPQISRGITAGFPEHYKQKLAESMFQTEEVTK